MYNSVLAACEAAQQLEAGLDVLDEMRVRCACCACCAVLQLLAQHSSRPALRSFLHDSTALWRWLFLPPSLFHSCPPSHAAFSSHPHSSSPPPPIFLQVSGVPRDNYTYSTLMSICQASGDLPTALRLFREMQEEGLTPNTGGHWVQRPCNRCWSCSACLAGSSQGAVGTAESDCSWLARLPISLV